MNNLTDLLPILASAMGDPQHRAAVMQGFLQTRRQFEQEDLLKQQASRQDQMAQAEIANRQADNARADQQLQIQRGNADLGRLEHFRSAAGQQAGMIAETATDPLAAQNELAAQSIGLRQDFGVPPTTTMPTPNMAGMISGRKKKRAGELYAEAEKRFGPEAMASDAITLKSPEFGDIKPSALRQMFETPAVSAQGMPAAPYVKPPAAAGTEKERAAQLLGKIDDAKTAGDTATAAKLQREYDNIVRATKEIGLADNTPKAAPRDRYSVQQVTNPDGTVSLVRVDLDANAATPIALPGGAAAGKPTDTERLSKAYLDRTEASNQTAAAFETSLLSLGPQFEARFPTLFQSEAGQRYKQAKDEFINAALRRESGAAIQPSEYTRFDKIYFAVPGDRPATIKQKQEARRRAVQGFRTTAGNLGGAQPTTAPPSSGNRFEILSVK